MSRRSHALEAYFGLKRVSTLPIRERRKTKAELDRMPIESRILYEAAHPLTDEEKHANLEREVRDYEYDTTGEVDERDILDNHPPPEWGE